MTGGLSSSKLAVGLVGAVAFVAGCPLGISPGDVGETAKLRVVHASPDAPAVDVCSGPAAVFQNAGFPAATPYATVSSGIVPARVLPAGAGCDSAGVIDAALALPVDSETTVVAVNFLSDIEPLVLEDDNSAPTAGMVKVRFVHAGPDAPTVDITLTDGTTLFDDIPFKGVGDYIEVPAGAYDLQVRDETGSVVVLTLSDISLDENVVYTVYAIGLLDGEPALNALITVDN